MRLEEVRPYIDADDYVIVPVYLLGNDWKFECTVKKLHYTVNHLRLYIFTMDIVYIIKYKIKTDINEV